MNPTYSVIIPVYNRPQEVDELLESLTRQTRKDFDVILVEDGSTVTSEKVYEKYSSVLPLSSYFEAVDKALAQDPLDAWGGPDRGSEHFTVTQRAMAYTMSSALTTGGIRGSSAKGFQPRSFNMGVRKEVFQKTRGFHFDRFAEDIEWSIRIKKAGFRVGLIPEAFVYHKRRTDFDQFFKQVSNFGKGRALVGRVHPDAVRITHWFPAFFLLGLLAFPIVIVLFRPLGLTILLAYCLYFAAIAVDAGIKTNSVAVALISVPSAFIQLTGYASGFLKEKLKSA